MLFNLSRQVIQFLGSLTFAIFLIGTSACLVIFGTILESKTESHLFASSYIYQSSLFKILLSGYFINILLSALRRFPFKKKHIPFLITHMGLLMIIAGVFIKTAFGIQGNLWITEGSSSDLVRFPNSFALRIENQRPRQVFFLPFKEKHGSLSFIDFIPNSEEKLTAWIHEDTAQLLGHPPFKATLWKKGDSFSKIKDQRHLAFITDNPKVLLENLLKEKMQLKVADTKTQKKIDDLTLDVQFKTAFDETNGFASVKLMADYQYKEKKGQVEIPLTGAKALLNLSPTNYLGKDPVTVDLECKPLILFIKDQMGKIHLIYIDNCGRLFFEKFDPKNLNSYVAYNEGFGGYSVQWDVPQFSLNRKELEKSWLKSLSKQLKSCQKKAEPLSPPLHFFLQNCSQNGHIELVKFLNEWDRQGGWLFPKNCKTKCNLEKINFDNLEPQIYNACAWISFFFEEVEKELIDGEKIQNILQKKDWPLLSHLEGLNEEETLTLVTEQLFAASAAFPKFPHHVTSKERLLSAYLRAYRIHLNNIPYIQPEPSSNLHFESPLKHDVTALPKKIKWEENIPSIIVANEKGEKISLTYDPLGKGLKWPLNNNLLSFEPIVLKIPYRVRLHRAKRTNYPDSDQAFAYECRLSITDQRNGNFVRKTISMNNVHETFDGYRFYLAGLSKNSSGINNVQIVVNRDPAKYFLTYPGAFLVGLGITLLFWFQKLSFYQKKK